MIKNKVDLKRYLECDAYVMGGGKPRLFGDEQWKFLIILRKHEYYLNTGKNRIMLCYYKFLHHIKGVKLGFEIPCNVFGPGLKINHYGYLIVNPKAKIGAWCDIHQGVNIGENTDKLAREIGDNVWIGPGAKIFGGIKIGNNIMIGANAVVNKSFEQDGVNIAGVPAKVINTNGNHYAKKYKY